MDADDLRGYRDTARDSPNLQNLPDSFYQDVAAYLEELRDRRATIIEQSDQPFENQEVQAITDQIEETKTLVEAIFNRRLAKILQQALIKERSIENQLTEAETLLLADLEAKIPDSMDEFLDNSENK